MFDRIVRVCLAVSAVTLVSAGAVKAAEEQAIAASDDVRWEADGWSLRAERRRDADGENRLVFEQVVMTSRGVDETSEGLKLRADAVVIERKQDREHSVVSWRAEGSVRIIRAHQLYIMSETASWSEGDRRRVVAGSDDEPATLLKSRAEEPSWRLPAERIVISISSGRLELRGVEARRGDDEQTD